MTATTVYRVCIWLPIVVPAILIVVVNLFGLSDAVGFVGEMVAYSLLYGGIPYAALGVWATWWVGGRPEPEVRRLMFRAPLLMVAVFVPLSLMVGLIVGAFVPFAAVAGLGAFVIILLGYTYVGLTVLIREELGPKVH